MEKKDKSMGNLWNFFYVLAASVGGGVIQTTTGFGYGIFVMLFFPLFLPLLQASALSSMIGMWLSATLAWRYRKHADYRSLWLPVAVYMVVSTLCITWSTRVNMGGLKAYFGLFLILVAVYFIFFSKRIHLRANAGSATVCSTLSGAASGFFGIGGPPMVLYYLAVAGEDKLKYLGSLQMFFLFTGISNIVSRAANGIITKEVLLLAIPGLIGQIIGKSIGLKIIDRINIEQLKRVIYFFLAVAGALTFFTNI